MRALRSFALPAGHDLPILRLPAVRAPPEAPAAYSREASSELGRLTPGAHHAFAHLRPLGAGSSHVIDPV
jgi:hypothetical protein